MIQQNLHLCISKKTLNQGYSVCGPLAKSGPRKLKNWPA